jgi:integration host factor subunit alpha
MTLTKERISGSVQKQLGVSTVESAHLVESVLETIMGTLESGEDVLISQFGKFTVREKGARRGRNPQTGEHLTLGSRRVVTFKCSRRLKDKINGKGDEASLRTLQADTERLSRGKAK